ncbi:MAG: glycerol-3-phosphate 1-O-acyltransferase PlsY [Alphaproteobacteria bacterium]|nr:glycerol-3-phosphate 1-O-acyltransferase PlsY [Alphaproteobacteria bacterium]
MVSILMKGLYLLAGYVIGSIPTGYLFMKFGKNQDIRTLGSGNIGATNVYRNAKKSMAAAVLVADAIKGIIPVLIARHYLGDTMGLWIGLSVVVGHIYSIFMGFRGGKGVATTIGVYASAYFPAVIFAAIIWGAVFKATNIVSIASIAMVFLVPFFAFIFSSSGVQAFVFMFMGMIVIYAHRDNIVRLIRGEEKPIQAFDADKQQQDQT